MEILYLLIGFVCGSLIFWFFARSVASKNKIDLISDIKKLQERVTDQALLLEEKSKLITEKDGEILDLATRLATAEADFQNLKQKLAEQKQEIENSQEKLRTEFKNLANDILEDKSRRFTQQNRENISEILKPLGEKIKDFEKKVDDTYEKGLKDQTDLKTELKRLHDLSLKLDEDARSLTNALKSDSKKQGNWGEVVLERVLERSGLNKGQEYFIQESARSEAGDLLRPDVIINLPDNKHIIIDAKVSLLAYEAFVRADSPDEKDRYLKQHVDSIKNHIKGLAEKNYQLAKNFDTPDFVLLFMPIESAFSAAVQTDMELFNFAWEKKIVVVSPTTLLATLRTVASIWKHEKQTQNAIEIARQSGAMYDKFVLFLKDLEKVGNQLGVMQKTYDEAHKKLSSGSGDLIGRAERLKKLGAKASKEIPGYLLEDKIDDEDAS